MGQCKCTAVSFCGSCRAAFLTGPVAGDVYTTHRENTRILRGQLEVRIAELKTELAHCEDELRRLG